MKYIVKVVSRKTKEVVKEIKCGSARKAEKVADGIYINLNHAEYFIETKEVKL